MWLAFGLELVVTSLLAQPVALDKEPVTVPLVSREDNTRKRLLEVARSPTQNVVLVLKGVEAASRPDASWEVHVEPVGAALNAQTPTLVGVISLFDRGKPAEFYFVIDDTIAAAGEKDLCLRFVPTSGVVVEGEPQAAEVRSPVTIGEIGVGIESAHPHQP